MIMQYKNYTRHDSTQLPYQRPKNMFLKNELHTHSILQFITNQILSRNSLQPCTTSLGYDCDHLIAFVLHVCVCVCVCVCVLACVHGCMCV